MQKVVNSVTLMLGERDQEIEALKAMNRGLAA
jgi:hypothetical protein